MTIVCWTRSNKWWSRQYIGRGSSLYDLLVTSIVHLLTRTSSDGGRWCTLSDVKLADALKFHKVVGTWSEKKRDYVGKIPKWRTPSPQFGNFHIFLPFFFTIL